jgi:hypothetical protein
MNNFSPRKITEQFLFRKIFFLVIFFPEKKIKKKIREYDFSYFFKKFHNFSKKHEKTAFPENGRNARISLAWCRFFMKRWDLQHLFGGGGYPLFSEYTKDRGSFLDPLFLGVFFLKKTEKFFLRKKNFLKNKKKFFIK